MSQVIFGNLVIVTLLCGILVAHMAVSEMVRVTIARDSGIAIVNHYSLFITHPCQFRWVARPTMTLVASRLAKHPVINYGVQRQTQPQG